MTIQATRSGRIAIGAGTLLLGAGTILLWPAAILAGWAVLLCAIASLQRLLSLGTPTARLTAPGIVRADEEATFVVEGDGDAFQRPDGLWDRLPGSLPLRWSTPGPGPLVTMAVRRRDRLGWWQVLGTADAPTVTVLPSAGDLARASEEARAVALVLRDPDTMGRLFDESSPEGIRVWVEGTPARHMDWKASSRLDTWMEKSFEREGEMEVDIVVDATAAARHQDGPDALSPLEVALPSALQLAAWARGQGRRCWVTFVGDDGVRNRVEAGTPAAAAELGRILDGLPARLEAAPAPGQEEGRLPRLLSLLRARGHGGLLASAIPPPGSEDAALFLVSPLELGPQGLEALHRATQPRHRRVLVQVGDLDGQASDARGLEQAYARFTRRRRNANRLAAQGWTCVDAPRPRSRAEVLRELAKELGR